MPTMAVDMLEKRETLLMLKASAGGKPMRFPI
jgi:hypothetical protein